MYKPVHLSQEALYLAWGKGLLHYKLHSGQRLIREHYRKCKGQLFVAECARQFGKSTLLVIEAIETAIAKPHQKIKYGTAFHTDLIQFILPTFRFVLSDCPQELLPIYKIQGSKYVFRNGSEIKLVGLDRSPNSLRGNVIDLAILDEAGFISILDYLYKSVIIPATTHRPNAKVILISTPPATPAHAFLDYVEKAQYEDAYVKLTIDDNPMLDQPARERLIEALGGRESTTVRRELYCEHITDANLALIPEWKDNYVEEIPRDIYYTEYHKYISMDLGVKTDFTAALYGYYDFVRACLIIEDEFVINGPDLTTEVLNAKLIEKQMALWGEMKVHLKISDNNNPLLLQDLSFLHKNHFMSTSKGSLEEMINAVKILISQGGLRVHPRCKQLIGCLRHGVWDKHRSKFGQSSVYGHYDALAALIYLVRNLNKSHNPIPIGFKMDQNNQIILPRTKESSRDLRQIFGTMNPI